MYVLRHFRYTSSSAATTTATAKTANRPRRWKREGTSYRAKRYTQKQHSSSNNKTYKLKYDFSFTFVSSDDRALKTLPDTFYSVLYIGSVLLRYFVNFAHSVGLWKLFSVYVKCIQFYCVCVLWFFVLFIFFYHFFLSILTTWFSVQLLSSVFSSTDQQYFWIKLWLLLCTNRYENTLTTIFNKNVIKQFCAPFF